MIADRLAVGECQAGVGCQILDLDCERRPRQISKVASLVPCALDAIPGVLMISSIISNIPEVRAVSSTYVQDRRATGGWM